MRALFYRYPALARLEGHGSDGRMHVGEPVRVDLGITFAHPPDGTPDRLVLLDRSVVLGAPAPGVDLFDAEVVLLAIADGRVLWRSLTLPEPVTSHRPFVWRCGASHAATPALGRTP